MLLIAPDDRGEVRLSILESGFVSIHIVVVAGVMAALVSPIRLQLQTELASSDTVLRRLTAEALAVNPGLLGGEATARAASQRIGPAGALPDPMLNAGVMNLVLPNFAFRESDFTEVDV